MIFSENRYPLFGIMRGGNLAPIPKASQLSYSSLSHALFDHPFAGCGLAQLALPVQQIEAPTDDNGSPRQRPAVGHMVEDQIAEDHYPDELGIDERREHRSRGDPVARDQQ